MMSKTSGSEREALSAIPSMLCHVFLSFSSSRSKSIINNVCLPQCGCGNVLFLVILEDKGFVNALSVKEMKFL